MQNTHDISHIANAQESPKVPLTLFLEWFAEAEEKVTPNPNAMSLATVTAENRPEIRTVLLKTVDERGFVFYTNGDSNKGRELAQNHSAALCFYWRELDKQIRINGPTQKILPEESDAYFATRPRGSQISAWASKQSQPMTSQKEMEERIKAFEEKYDGQEIPRPPHWTGYRLAPERYEFWQQGDFRIHTRVLYTKSGMEWKRQLLYP